ncbi:MAG TPA: hypothetical protein VMT47_11745 [Polyangia bacterium]|nr:hypothetical protein [Polyangia bacterium]
MNTATNRSAETLTVVSIARIVEKQDDRAAALRIASMIAETLRAAGK